MDGVLPPTHRPPSWRRRPTPRWLGTRTAGCLKMSHTCKICDAKFHWFGCRRSLGPFPRWLIGSFTFRHLDTPYSRIYLYLNLKQSSWLGGHQVAAGRSGAQGSHPPLKTSVCRRNHTSSRPLVEFQMTHYLMHGNVKHSGRCNAVRCNAMQSVACVCARTECKSLQEVSLEPSDVASAVCSFDSNILKCDVLKDRAISFTSRPIDLACSILYKRVISQLN
jgi:hypothetical protein